MKTKMRPHLLTFIAPLFIVGAASSSKAQQLEITQLNLLDNQLTLGVSHLTAGGTYYIESNTSLSSNQWSEIGSFEGFEGTTNWTHLLPSSTNQTAFFRVQREDYHPKVGETATLTTRAHGVAGTAHIVNNHTLELRNFNYDGQGVFVQVYLSPNATFTPYTAVGNDLIRTTAYVDETLTFTLPADADLDSFNYISIWCVPVGASFGDGSFN